MKKISRLLGAFVLCVLIAALVGTALLTGVYLLPAEAMTAHMDASAQLLIQEGTYPKLYPWCNSQLDNFTDAIILMTAACGSTDSPPTQAMTAARPRVADKATPVEELEAHYRNGVPYDGVQPYYQYWHGYLLFMKPLLLLTDYAGIRIFNAVAQTVLLAFLLAFLVKRGHKRYILPYIISLAFLMPVALAKSLQFSSCYYIMTLGSIAVLLMEKRVRKQEPYLFVFLFLGIATAFFDFLTYPIATLGVPGVFYFLSRKRIDLMKESLVNGFGLCFSWGFGYVAMWANKWLLGSLVTGQNIFLVASDKLRERSFLNTLMEEKVTRWLWEAYNALYANVTTFFRTPAAVLLFLAAVAALTLMFVLFRRYQVCAKEVAVTFFPFVILALIPLVWYVLTTNHSGMHHWFTCKALSVSVFAALCAPVKLYEQVSLPLRITTGS